MARISVGSYEPAEVELWGHEFETVEVTKKLRKKLKPYGEKVVKIGDGTYPELPENEGLDEDQIEDKAVAEIGAMLDIRLRATDGKRTKPSTLLTRKWNDGTISLARAFGILGSIGRADLPS